MNYVTKTLFYCSFGLSSYLAATISLSEPTAHFSKSTQDALHSLKNHKSKLLIDDHHHNNIESISIETKIPKNTDLYHGQTQTEASRHLTLAEKNDLFKKDTKLKMSVQKFAQGMSESIMQPDDIDHFKLLTDDEQSKVCKEYLRKKKQVQHEDLLLNKKQYLHALTQFQTQTFPKTRKTIKELIDALKKNDYSIQKSEQLLKEKSKSDHERKHLTINIHALKIQNESIKKQILEHIKVLQKQISEIDQSAIKTHNHLIQLYNNQDQKFIAGIKTLLNNNQKLTTHMPKDEEHKQKTEKINLDISHDYYTYQLEEYQPDVPLDILAQNPLLDTFIHNVEDDLKNELQQQHPKENYITYNQEHLAYLKKAQQYRDQHRNDFEHLKI